MARPGFRRSVRARLLIVALLPMLVLTPVLLGITMQRWLMRTDQILSARVASDLTVARQYLDHLIGNTRQGVESFGRSGAFQSAATAQIDALLTKARQAAGLDFLMLIDGRTQSARPAIARLAETVATGKSGLAVLEPDMIAQISPELAARAQVPLVAAPGSRPHRPPAPTTENRALVALASFPVAVPGGEPGLLIGGILLNKNENFIDSINDLVYPATNPLWADRVGEGLDHGIITLFLDDARIATTLRPDGGERAIGTRASAAVTAQVLGEGRSWHDTAFVVNGWYISAYEALTDIGGKRVGMLYAGIPKAPYTNARRLTFLMIGAAFLLVGGLFVPLALSWVRGVFRPLEAMGATIRRVEAGDLAARTGDVAGAEELARVAHHLDQLLSRLAQRERELRGLNDDLNARVAARTADLSRANQALELSNRQLLLSEKLATIGQVTAGVAHEINNPLAVLSGNLEVIRMILAEREPEVGTELRLIDDQIQRISRLVTQLLQFARPEEFTDGAATDPVQAVETLRPLVRHMLTGDQIRMDEDLASSHLIRMNPHEFQQLLINLIANAVQAMPRGGVVTLGLRDRSSQDGQPGVLVTLRDDGRGMDEQTLAHLFDPFFTTRGSDGGTGLGLTICLNLVTRQGGTLTATSQPGAGSCFQIWLPAALPA